MIISCATQMDNDIEDYYGNYNKKKGQKAREVYESAINKLRLALNKKTI